jgi:sn-1 stearoyl-lipid 9-desaturase
VGMMNEATALSALSFVGWFLVFYLYHGLGVTLGYHRLLTHRSLQVPRWLMYFIVSGGYLCLMGSPIVWVGVHRLHHQKSDQEGDPHSPLHGFKHALYGWMFEMKGVQTDEEMQTQAQDLMQDPFFRMLGTEHEPYQAQLCLAISVAVALFIALTLGWIPALANVVTTAIVFWSTQLVNAACHSEGMGYRSHDTRESSRNLWWVGILALGEGWHNNHHAMPKSARHGLAWFEVDVTWYAICILEKLGLATKVVRPLKLSKNLASQSEPTTTNTAIVSANILRTLERTEQTAEPSLQ